MDFFFEVVETVPKGVGFTHFDRLHAGWIAAFIAVSIVSAFHYRKLGVNGRNTWRKVIAVLLVLDEFIKQTLLICTGNWIFKYLPLHLCSINIFLIVYHCLKPGKVLGNFLYMVCLPGALAALLFPTWTKLPGWNMMCIHSFTVHILLALYPLVLVVNGDIKPEAKNIPKSLGVLVILAAVVYGANLLLGTNFFFLMSASKGNPLYWFKQHWGNHLYGFPVLIAGILLAMYGPVEICRRMKKGRTRNAFLIL